MTSTAPDIGTAADFELRLRVGRAWREIRRGASARKVKDLFYSSGDDEAGLDMALADALTVLCLQGPMRMGELADALRITPASTTRAVACLAEEGLVQREKDDDDQRTVRVSATKAGHHRNDIVSSRIHRGLADILDHFDGEEAQLASFLERFVEAIDQMVATTEECKTDGS
ncbi:MAG: MarR family winged helix-turn-helix transcriptional regulator [Acidimicrobiales bacterium]